MEDRLQVLEGMVSDMRVAQGRLEERQAAHATLSTTQNAAVLSAISDLKRDIEPLKATRWKLHGVTSALAIITSAVVTFFLRKMT